MKKQKTLARYFEFNKFQTSFTTETIAGVTTFLSMAYILFVNPSVLGDAGMDKNAVFTATALVSAFGTLIMGLLARYPIGVAPGMGINAFFTYSVVIGSGVPWQTALAAVILAGILFVLLTLFKIRNVLLNAIPQNLKMATASGIGLLITFIGLKNAGIVVKNEDTFVALGDITAPHTLLAILGTLITMVLLVRNVRGGIFIGLAATALIGILTGLIPTPDHVFSSAPSLAPTFGVGLSHLSDIHSGHLIIVVLTFLIVGFFDTAGTIMAVSHQAGLIQNNQLPRSGRALFASSSSFIVGGILGTSPANAYVESSAGVAAGGRTGFSAVVTAIFFLLATFLSPLLSVVTNEVTAPALIVVGSLMASAMGSIEWKRSEIAIPAFITIIAMPLTYSITNGIVLGFITYPILMTVKGRFKELHPMMIILFIIFIFFIPFLSS
ncbi:AGZA family xanthine/uracil permease-like MFS transporter [Pullulanibacillus pueri]|uniref:Guanine permease n=1 Tax=Pullulanibacillus pueri TaxID=1437324 RepID=A0A8J2ZTM5_9BACL|nr:NCS2 family permease [Pullulanibacillus pueri]MBM7680355.1 AGZA family xanthine/uracil permease-like MFS transporter [Pullulanibacillus pueri]GGH75488.1 guanine permease [Pullulanibacillus pueri]